MKFTLRKRIFVKEISAINIRLGVDLRHCSCSHGERRYDRSAKCSGKCTVPKRWTARTVSSSPTPYQIAETRPQHHRKLFKSHACTSKRATRFKLDGIVWFHNIKRFGSIYVVYLRWERCFQGGVHPSSVENHLSYDRSVYHKAGQRSKYYALHVNKSFVDIVHGEE